MRDQQLVNHVRVWLQNFVIGLHLCPFAERELNSQRVRFTVTHAADESSLLLVLQNELQSLQLDTTIGSTLLIHPDVLQEFDDYNQFLNLADACLQEMGLEGVFQIASFHPDYRFAESQADDAANYTNRSPYPMLHLLREASVESAIVTYPDITSVPAENIKRMRQIGNIALQERLALCSDSLTD